MGRHLALVVAHPDDDTFGSAGTVGLHAGEPAFRFTLVHATSGEQGEIADPALATREALGRVREEEDRRSWIALGREPDRHEWLRYPDSALSEVELEELANRVATVLDEERPEVVITFGPDGVTGHPDHIAIGEATTRAFHRLKGSGPGLARLIHTAIPQSVLDEWNRQQVAAGREPFDPTRLYDPRGVPDQQIGIDVDTSSVAPRVLAALREHRTQAGDFADMPEDQQLAMLGRERGVVAWPVWHPGDRVLADIFEGL